MGANIGSTAIADVKLGNTQVDKIYLGSTEIWSKSAPVTIKALKFTSPGAQTLGVDTSVLGTVQPNFEYSTDDGATWTSWDVTTTIPFGNGTDLYLRGSNTQLASSGSEYTKFVFSTSSQVVCSGNIMHLLDYTQDLTSFPAGSERNFQGLFYNCTALVSAPNLPATVVTPHCYQNMFRGCSSLTTPSALPATTLAEYCYYGIFNGCTALETCPTLPSTTLAQYCYAFMFFNCSSITTPPALPATTLIDYCYYDMFEGCTALVSAPVLPATTMAPHCYQSMLYGCQALTTPPSLPATTLATACYRNMFNNCILIESIPALPATSLVSECYQGMFLRCAKIKMSVSQTGEYTNAYTFGSAPNSTYANDMFGYTGGTFTGTPTQQTYYTSNQIIS